MIVRIVSVLLTVVLLGQGKPADLEEIGLSLEIPASWTANGNLIRTTAGEFHRQVYDEPYTRADSGRVVVGAIGYASFNVDSTLLPDPAAYQAHELKIEMYGYYGWYKRWLWSGGKRQFRESHEDFFLERMSDLQGNPTYDWIEQEVLDDEDDRKIIKDAFAIEFKWQPKQSALPLQAQLYYIVEGDRCYRIQIGGTQLNYEESRTVYESVLRSIAFEE